MIQRLLAAFSVLVLLASTTQAGTVVLKQSAVLPQDATSITVADVAVVRISDVEMAERVQAAELNLDPGDADQTGALAITRQSVIDAIDSVGVRRSGVAVSGETLTLRLHPRDARLQAQSKKPHQERAPEKWHVVEDALGQHPLTDAVLQTILADHSCAADAVRIRYDTSTVQRMAQVESGSQYVLERVSTPNSSRGVFRVTMHAEDGVLEKPLTIAMDIELLQDTLVLTNEVRRGQAITGADFIVEQRWRGPASTSLLTVEGTAAAPLAKTRLAPGTVLTAVNTEPPTIVLRRQSVRVYAHANGIAVRIDAIALDDGSLGDLVRCQPVSNRRSRTDDRVIMARVTAPGELVFEAGNAR